ncbi:MAG: 2-polyprenylphenol 6-hydroxylase [Pseudomonadota bacterium]|nr:2-polyprenylphenol 6-hydroxylase [Pseudomonadota bacterium]
MFGFDKYARIIKIQAKLVEHGLDEILLTKSWMRIVLFLFRLHPSTRKKTDKEFQVGESVRLVLEDLGPFFIKLGQILSTRRDVIPDHIAFELGKLQDSVPPFSGNVAKNIIEESFGKKLNEVFDSFDMKPIASASIAQVHIARLVTGEEVVVKVVRPDIRPVIEKDVDLMYFLARIMEKYWPPAKSLRPTLIVEELEKTIIDELDMLREAANAAQLARNCSDQSNLIIPRVFWRFTNDSVLVAERIKGITITDITRLEKAGISPSKLAIEAIEILFTQVFRDHFFHADMHPGNIFVVPGQNNEKDKIALVDFGIMGSLNEFDQRYLAENCAAFFERDYRRVAELHVESGWVPESTRVDEFEFAIRSVCEPILDRPASEISIGNVLLRLFQTAQRFDMEVLPQMLLLQKTLVSVEGIGRQLDPNLDLWTAAQPSVNEFMSKRISVLEILKNAGSEIPSWIGRLPNIPSQTFDLLDKLRMGRLILRTQDPELRNIKDAVNKLKRTLLLTITGFCLILLSLILSSLEIDFLASTAQPFLMMIFAVGGVIVLLRGLFGSDDNL